jgi:hypothetical protein
MSKFAATITIPVTKANMQENSTRSITSLVICTLPDLRADSRRLLSRPAFNFGRKVTGLPQIGTAGVRSNAERDKLNRAQSDKQHDEHYRIVIEPMPTHDVHTHFDAFFLLAQTTPTCSVKM